MVLSPSDAFGEVLALSLFMPLACGGVSSPDGGNGGNGGNGIDRSVLTVRVQVDSKHEELAETLGWEGGIVAGADVALRREGSDGTIEDPLTATAGADGAVEFQDLVAGTYRLSALRLLTSDEVALAEGENPTLRAFGGGRKIQQAAGQVDLEIVPNRTGDLVVSEMSTVDKPVSLNPGGSTMWVGFFELYNNSGQTIYLDGRLFGRAYTSLHDFNRPCAEGAVFANDADGLWARLFQRFPGNGTEYPVAPGEAVVIAHDAIDHSQVDPDFLDLSDADFELDGPADPDNPAVPNLIEESTDPIIGNGIQMLYGVHPPFVTSPLVAVSSLPQDRPLQPLTDAIFVRIPVGDVIDTFAQILSRLTTPSGICPRALHARFDQLAYVYDRGLPDAHLKSQQRKVVGTAPGGWQILLDTNTSAVDFHEASRTPGTLPP